MTAGQSEPGQGASIARNAQLPLRSEPIVSEGVRRGTSAARHGVSSLPVSASSSSMDERAPSLENRIAGVVVDAAVHVHRVLGPGLLESMYEVVLAYELEQRGLRVARQVPIPVVYEALRVEGAFRADLIVEDRVLVEVKSLERTAPVHTKQALTYLRLAHLRLGLLLNFGARLMKNGVTRIANGLPEPRD